MARATQFVNRRRGRGRLLPTYRGRVYIAPGGGSLSGSVSELASIQDATTGSLFAFTAPAIEWPTPWRGSRNAIAKRGWINVHRPALFAPGIDSVSEVLSTLDTASARATYGISVAEVALVFDSTDATGGTGPTDPPVLLGGRAITQAVANAIVAGTVRPVIFYEGEFSGGTVRLWSGLAPLSWNGVTWTGAGNMLGISAIGETSEVRAVAFEVSLSGAISELVSVALSQGRQGLPGRVWLGFFDDSGNLISEPFKSFDGRMDVMDITDDAVTARIGVYYESRLINLDRTRERRYTSEDQRLDYPSDLGFDYVPGLQNMPLFWGRVSPEIRQQRLIDAQAAYEAWQLENAHNFQSGD
jgi:hypothetical protein